MSRRYAFVILPNRLQPGYVLRQRRVRRLYRAGLAYVLCGLAIGIVFACAAIVTFFRLAWLEDGIHAPAASLALVLLVAAVSLSARPLQRGCRRMDRARVFDATELRYRWLFLLAPNARHPSRGTGVEGDST